MKEILYTITDPVGLHARTAGSFVKAAQALLCDVTLSDGVREVDAKRPIVFSPDDERGRFPEKHIKLRGLLDGNPIRAESWEDCRSVIIDY